MKKPLAIAWLISTCCPAWGMEVRSAAQAAPKVTLQSSNGKTFTIDKELISKSRTIKDMFEDITTKNPDAAIPLPATNDNMSEDVASDKVLPFSTVTDDTLQTIIDCLERPANADISIAKLSGDSLVAFIQAIVLLDIPELVAELPAIEWLLSKNPSFHVFTGHKSWVLSVALSADGMTAFTGSSDNTARMWYMPQLKQLQALDLNQLILIAKIHEQAKQRSKLNLSSAEKTIFKSLPKSIQANIVDFVKIPPQSDCIIS